MKTTWIKIGTLLGVIGMVLISCSKLGDKLTSNDEAILLAKDDISADDIYIEVDGIVETKIAELEEAGFQTTIEKCAIEDAFECLEVSVNYPDSTRFPKVITFDYGEGCEVILRQDTFVLEGKMIVTLSDHFLNPGAQKITTFEDFYVNEKKVEGVLTNTYLGMDTTTGYMQFQLTLEGGRLIFADVEGNELTYTRDADFTKQWLRTRDHQGDTILLDGSMWGTNTTGAEYTREITKTLVLVHCRDYGHRWVIIDGEVTSTVDGEATVTDYSDGGCDGTAEVIWMGDGLHQMLRIHDHHRNRHHGGGQGGNGGSNGNGGGH
ncbi:MAG: hypothetical protein JW801_01845 [Bacteroidales bacterium]|nr:hypothetical protein [Bacteroidales bacterium]